MVTIFLLLSFPTPALALGVINAPQPAGRSSLLCSMLKLTPLQQASQVVMGRGGVGRPGAVLAGKDALNPFPPPHTHTIHRRKTSPKGWSLGDKRQKEGAALERLGSQPRFIKEDEGRKGNVSE